MTLISFGFLLLVTITGLIYFLLPEKLKQYQWVVLLVSSLFFYIYTCNKYSFYIFLTIISTYLCGLKLQKLNDQTSLRIKEQKGIWSAEEKKKFKASMQNKKKLVTALALVFNFGILALLKYLGFIFAQADRVLSSIGLDPNLPALKLVLPLGISFYTFQAMGYIIDIYRKKVTAERNIAKLSLFLSFFPQIIQGPIAIYSDLAHQLFETHKFSYDRFKRGGILILWGMFKKLVIADRAVSIVTYIPEHFGKYQGSVFIFAGIVYAIQLYADFSGGVDMCRGVAEIYGITMAENFRRPYFSKTLTEYWHRWHITLGDWLRNYLFYPISLSKPFLKMGKNLKKVNKNFGKVLPTSIASLITFVVIGIWHGSELRYVAFGLWNGLVIMLSSFMQPVDKKIIDKLKINVNKLPYKVFAMARTFIFVLVGYFFDISKSVKSAVYMMYKGVTDFHLADLKPFFKISKESLIPGRSLDLQDILMIFFGAFIIFIISVIQEKKQEPVRDILSRKKLPVQWIVYIMLIMGIIICGTYGPGVSPADFVYMQF